MRWKPLTIDVNGTQMTLRQLAAAHGLSVRTVLSRYRRTKTLDAARLTRPADQRYTRRGNW